MEWSLIFGGLTLGSALVSDASGLWGCGAPTGEWFQIHWPIWWREKSIAAKELLPIVVSATLWGKAWTRLQIPFICDNLGVVQALSSRCVRDPHIMHLLRCLLFIKAKFGFEHTASHIAGKNNGAADTLSCGRVGVFHNLIPYAPQMPSFVPAQLLELLSDPDLDWTDVRWARLQCKTSQLTCSNIYAVK